MTLDLVPVWTVVLAIAVFMYVLLDGFDLGVGILFPFAPDDHSRDLMMNSVAPIWDGNETWLVLGSMGLFAAFPVAFAIIMSALYFPVLLMLLGLLFRGVAFEYRANARTSRRYWDLSFFGGSLIATFAQGCVLGQFVHGFAVRDGQYIGSTFDWFNPFALAVGVGLVVGYTLLGATWLVMKTQGELQDWARRHSRVALFGVLAFIALVSIWTPTFEPSIATRWFSWPNMLMLSPVPIITAGIGLWVWRSLNSGADYKPFFGSMALFVMCYLGLAISLFPYIVPHAITLEAAAAAPNTQAFLLLGTLFLIPIILTYTGWSYWVFRGKVRSDIGYH